MGFFVQDSGYYDAFIRQKRVLHAVILRNIRTRFFGHGLGYLVAIGWPLAHILIVVVFLSAMNRAPPFGASYVVFLATATVPFMTFSYLSRFMMVSLLMTKPLLAFPEVKIFDILFASAILEILTSCLVTLILIGLAWSFDVVFWPRDIVQASFAMGTAILLGVGFGILNGVVMMAAPLWLAIYSLIIIALWIASGVAFVPSYLPESIRNALAYNPITHSLEWMRTAFYEDYNSLILDKTYVVSFGVISILLGLLLERGIRGHVLASR